ncbi:MAG: DUF2505 family protein [Acidimicrobiales bacterium]
MGAGERPRPGRRHHHVSPGARSLPGPPDRGGPHRRARVGDGSERIVSGELKVRALLVAGKVEQAIVDGLAEYLAAEAPAVDRYLSS